MPDVTWQSLSTQSTWSVVQLCTRGSGQGRDQGSCVRGGQETVSCGACAINADPRLAMETRAAKRRRLDAPCCATPWLTLPRGILMHVFELGLKCLGRDVIANARLACREWHSVYREVQEQDTCCSRPGRRPAGLAATSPCKAAATKHGSGVCRRGHCPCPECGGKDKGDGPGGGKNAVPASGSSSSCNAQGPPGLAKPPADNLLLSAPWLHFPSLPLSAGGRHWPFSEAPSSREVRPRKRQRR